MMPLLKHILNRQQPGKKEKENSSKFFLFLYVLDRHVQSKWKFRLQKTKKKKKTTADYRKKVRGEHLYF